MGKTRDAWSTVDDVNLQLQIMHHGARQASHRRGRGPRVAEAAQHRRRRAARAAEPPDCRQPRRGGAEPKLPGGRPGIAKGSGAALASMTGLVASSDGWRQRVPTPRDCLCAVFQFANIHNFWSRAPPPRGPGARPRSGGCCILAVDLAARRGTPDKRPPRSLERKPAQRSPFGRLAQRRGARPRHGCLRTRGAPRTAEGRPRQIFARLRLRDSLYRMPQQRRGDIRTRRPLKATRDGGKTGFPSVSSLPPNPLHASFRALAFG